MTTIRIQKTHEQAVVPKAATEGDVGYDLTAIKFVKQLTDNTYMWDTCVCVEPPVGYYTEIVPRSSIVKSGWFLSNSVGVIDQGYRGSLKICLTCIHDSTPMPSLPFTLCQLILKKAEPVVFELVDDLSSTTRGDGGFGSTNK